jgi:uncharacterized protein
MSGYLFKLVPPRPDFAFTMSDDEKATMLEHVRYWGELASAGKTLAFGPVNDPAGGYGVGIVLAENLEDAERVRDGDPAMRSSHGFRTEIFPMLSLVTPSASYDAAG